MVEFGDENVRGLEIAVNDPFLMGVLHCPAHRKHQFQPLPGRKLAFVAELSDRHATDQLHHEIWPPRLGCSRVEHLGDMGVLHECQGLSLRLEAGDDLATVHSRLDDLQCDATFDRAGLLSQVNDAHPAFADLLQKLVWPYVGAGPFRRDRSFTCPKIANDGRFEELTGCLIRPEQRLHFIPQLRIAGAGLVKKRPASLS